MELTKYLDEQVEMYLQTIEFMPFYKARLQQKQGPCLNSRSRSQTLGTLR